MPKSRSAAGGLLADRGDLDPGERPRVQAVLLELLPDRADRVDRGEGDPLVAAGDQALDRTVHLLRRAGRLDRDRGHLLGHGALLAQLLGHGAPPAPWSAAPAPASRTAAWSRTRTARAARRRRHRPRPRGLTRVDQADPGRLQVGRDPAQGGGDGPLGGGGAVPGNGERRGVRPARGDQHLAQVGRARLGAQDDQGAGAERDPAGVRGLDDPDLAALTAERDARVGRYRGSGRDPRHHLERHPGRRERTRLGGGAAVQQRVAVVEPDHQLAGLRGRDQVRLGHRTGPGARGGLGARRGLGVSVRFRVVLTLVPVSTTTSAPGAISSRTRGPGSRRLMTRSAWPSSWAARKVSSRSSPGPAPTSAIRPADAGRTDSLGRGSPVGGVDEAGVAFTMHLSRSCVPVWRSASPHRCPAAGSRSGGRAARRRRGRRYRVRAATDCRRWRSPPLPAEDGRYFRPRRRRSARCSPLPARPAPSARR